MVGTWGQWGGVQSSPCDKVTGTSQGWINSDAPPLHFATQMQLSSRQVSRRSVNLCASKNRALIPGLRGRD